MTEDFIRQRRNLYIVSGILLFAFLAKVDISGLTITGISFSSFDNPEMTYTFLWVIWAYFLYRFFVYFFENERETFLKIWRREIGRQTNRKLESIAIDHCDHEYAGNVNDYYSMKASEWRIHFQEKIHQERYDPKFENRILPIRYFQVALPISFGAIRFCILTPAVTNYLLPAILSIALLISAGFSEWEGSLTSIFR